MTGDEGMHILEHHGPSSSAHDYEDSGARIHSALLVAMGAESPGVAIHGLLSVREGRAIPAIATVGIDSEDGMCVDGIEKTGPALFKEHLSDMMISVQD